MSPAPGLMSLPDATVRVVPVTAPDPPVTVLPLAAPEEARLGLWVFAATLASVILATGDGYLGDLNYWAEWTRHLQSWGYVALPANYPPLFVHWLWLTGKFLSFFQLRAQPDLLLRLLVMTPALLGHVGLLVILDRMLRRFRPDGAGRLATAGFVALNPALLFDGPFWGQVDILFCVFVVVALHLLIVSRRLAWVFPLLTLALLTKFQTIFVAPVLAPLLWHRRRSKTLFAGILPAILLAALILWPYWRAGSLVSMVQLAYLQASSTYPVASLNAHNLWYLLGLNGVADTVLLFDRTHNASGWLRIFSPKGLGLILFAGWSLMLSVSSLRRDEAPVHWRNAVLAGLGFFLLLPAMHERYVFPALIMMLGACAADRKLHPHALILTGITCLNMLLVAPLRGGWLPQALAAATIAWALAFLAGEHRTRRLLQLCMQRIPGGTWIAASFVLWALTLGWQVSRHLPRNGRISATVIGGRQAQQDWGRLGIDLSVEGRGLSVGGEAFSEGFGTHARSTIRIPVPENAVRFQVKAGMDDEGKGGGAAFSIRLDSIPAWESGRMRSGEPSRFADVDVQGKRWVELVVDPLENNYGDHADWLSPSFQLK